MNKEKRVVGYFSDWINLQDIESKSKGYTDVLFAFWVDPTTGVAGAAEAAKNDPQLIKKVKEMGKKCILAAGGATMQPLAFDPVHYGTELAKYAIEHQYDGVDLDIENIQMNEDSINWLSAATNSVVQVCQETNYQLIISHAPQAPYFQNGDLSYAEVEKRTNGAIDFYNIQYYNQGSWAYQSYENYESIFETTYEGIINPTSILSITQNSVIPPEKLVVGKPVTKLDATNTGYIPIDELASIFEKAEHNQIEFGGVMGWKIDSDQNGIWGVCMHQTLLETSYSEN